MASLEEITSDVRDHMEEEDPPISSDATDLAEHSRMVGGVLIEQPMSGSLPFPDYRYLCKRYFSLQYLPGYFC